MARVEDELVWIAPELSDEATRGRTLEAMTRQMFDMRRLYAGLGFAEVDFLFHCFLSLYGRFGRFSYGPLTIECRVVEEMFARTCTPLPPGQLEQQVKDPGGIRFYRSLAAELARSGGRRVDELHWLLAFMRTDEGLPAKVFGELGVSPEAVERYARSAGREATPEPARRQPSEKLYTPEEVAEYLGVHVQTVRVWIRGGKLPARKLAGLRALRIRESDLEAVLEPVDLPNVTTLEREA